MRQPSSDLRLNPIVRRAPYQGRKSRDEGLFGTLFVPTGTNVKDPRMIRLDLDEDLWIDDWNDPAVVAASLALAGELDPDLFTPPAAA